jgi:hypothetical protein
MSNDPAELFLDRSDSRRICLARRGVPVSIDEVIRDGFRIRADDAPAILTLVERFLCARDENQK